MQILQLQRHVLEDERNMMRTTEVTITINSATSIPDDFWQDIEVFMWNYSFEFEDWKVTHRERSKLKEWCEL